MSSTASSLPGIPALPGSPTKDFYVSEETATHAPGGSPLGHYHKEAECLYVLEGNLSFQVNESRMVLHEGEVLIVMPGILHHDLIREEGTRLIRILMDPALLTREADIRRRFIHPFFTSEGKDCLLLPSSHPLSAPVRSLVLEMEQIESSKDPYKGLRIAASLHLLLYHLCRAFPPEETKKPLPSREDREIQKRMIHYINENFGEKITLDAIAAAGQVSKSKCSSLFKTYIGLSPIDYVNEYRLGVSKTLLEREDTAISDIAYTCGFTSQSYFTKLFSRSFHMTPREYRAAARKT